AVDLAGRGQEVAGALRQRQSDRLDRAEAADLERLDAQSQVLRRRRRTGQVHDEVDRAVDVDAGGDVPPDEGEVGPADQVGDVVLPAGAEVVDADDIIPPVDQRVADV